MCNCPILWICQCYQRLLCFEHLVYWRYKQCFWLFGCREKLAGFCYTLLPTKDQCPSVIPMCDMAPQKLGPIQWHAQWFGGQRWSTLLTSTCALRGSSWNWKVEFYGPALSHLENIKNALPNTVENLALKVKSESHYLVFQEFFRNFDSSLQWRLASHEEETFQLTMPLQGQPEIKSQSWVRAPERTGLEPAMGTLASKHYMTKS